MSVAMGMSGWGQLGDAMGVGGGGFWRMGGGGWGMAVILGRGGGGHRTGPHAGWVSDNKRPTPAHSQRTPQPTTHTNKEKSTVCAMWCGVDIHRDY